MLLLQSPIPPTFSSATYLASYGPPQIVLAGDADGDGRTDLLVFNPDGKGNIEFRKVSPLGKLRFGAQARSEFGAGGIGAACGDFAEPKKASVLVVLGDGSVRLEHDMRPGGTKFEADDLVAGIPKDELRMFQLRRGEQVKVIAGDFLGREREDALIVSPNGRLILLANGGVAGGKLTFKPEAIGGSLGPYARLSAGDLAGTGTQEIIWEDQSGSVWRSRLAQNGGALKLQNPLRIVSSLPGAGLAAGHFLGHRNDDLIVGQELLPGGDAAKPTVLSRLPSASVSKDDAEWMAADLYGDGEDDLIRVRRSDERFTGNDVYAHFAPGHENFIDSSNDGLLDGWKTGAIKPGGLDLSKLGCSPLHKDIIVEVQRMEDVPEARVTAELEKVRGYYASLPVENLDGSKGIYLHIIFREPIPLADRGKPWWELGDKYHPANHRGITHWMVVNQGGGGQSGEMTDRGGCGANALYAVFIHEFGHQLGLGHSGGWPVDGCPIYPSLMNYPYSYQLNGKYDDIGYSDGRLAGVVLDEHHLDKYLPLPPDKVKFLAGPPYHFHIKAASDGKGTMVDWNWDGKYSEKNIAADIDYGYSTTAGLRHTIGKTYTSPSAVIYGSGENARLLLLTGDLMPNAAVPAADGTEKEPSLSNGRPGRIVMREWNEEDPSRQGDKWTAPLDVVPSGVTGDPSSVWLNGCVWLAYPTAAGIALSNITLGKDLRPVVGKTTLVPNSQNKQATLIAFEGQMALFDWRDSATNVTMRLIAVKGGMPAVGPEIDMGFASEAPIGAAEGARFQGDSTLWVALNQDQDKSKTFRLQVRRFVVSARHLRQIDQEWVGGEKGGERGPSRICLLWEPNKSFQPDGELYLFFVGLYSKESPWSCTYVSTKIADKNVNGGWLTRRYYDEWTQSRSAPGVCYFRGDIAFASRWVGYHDGSNDNLFVAFFGRGIESAHMGDFDDIGFIRDVGMSRSISSLNE